MTSTEQTTIPTCFYCELPLTEEERDPETGSYSHAHFASCVNEDPEGRYEVIEATNYFRGNQASTRRYSTAKRAIAEATHLNDSNTPFSGARFAVTDLDTGERIFLGDLMPTFVAGEGYVGAPIELELVR